MLRIERRQKKRKKMESKNKSKNARSKGVRNKRETTVFAKVEGVSVNVDVFTYALCAYGYLVRRSVIPIPNDRMVGTQKSLATKAR